MLCYVKKCYVMLCTCRSNAAAVDHIPYTFAYPCFSYTTATNDELATMPTRWPMAESHYCLELIPPMYGYPLLLHVPSRMHADKHMHMHTQTHRDIHAQTCIHCNTD